MRSEGNIEQYAKEVIDQYRVDDLQVRQESLKREQDTKDQVLELLSGAKPPEEETGRFSIRVFWIILLVFGLLTAGIIFLIYPKHVEITITNLEPYPVRTALSYPIGNGQYENLGWYDLAPGESRTVELTIPRLTFEESILLYAESNDPDILMMLHDGEFNTVTFQAGESTSLRPVHLEQNFITSSFNQGARFVDTTPVVEDTIPHDPTWMPFSYVQLERKSFLSLNYSAQEKIIGPDYIFLFDDNEEERRIWASQFYASLQRNYRFTQQYASLDDYPFSPGFSYSDSVDYLAGVTVEEVAEIDLFGNRFGLAPGDEIIAMNGATVFNMGDVFYKLAQFGQTRGITGRILYTVIREGQELYVSSSYFFNEDYWRPGPKEQGQAFRLGALGAALFNNRTAMRVANNIARGIRNLFSIHKVEIETQFAFDQRLFRLRQFFPESFDNGQTLGMFLPTPLAILNPLKVLRWTKGASRLKHSKFFKLTSFTVVSALEDAIFIANSGSLLRPKDELMEHLPKEVAFGAGINILIGSLTFR